MAWVHSNNDEIFNFDGTYPTKEAAIKAANEYCYYEAGDSLYVGETKPLDIEDMFQVDTWKLEEQAAEQMFDQVGEAGEDWELSDKDREWLRTCLAVAIAAFAARINWTALPFRVVNVEKVGIAIDDPRNA